MIGTTETTMADNCIDRLVVLLWCAAAFKSLGACDWLITSIRRYGIVLRVFVFIKKVESYQLFQCPTPTKSASVAIKGLEIGMIMLRKILNSPAPSILADSLSDSGIPSKKVHPIVI